MTIAETIQWLKFFQERVSLSDESLTNLLHEVTENAVNYLEQQRYGDWIKEAITDEKTAAKLEDLWDDNGHIFHRRKWVCQNCFFVVRKNDLYCGHCGKKISEWWK